MQLLDRSFDVVVVGGAASAIHFLAEFAARAERGGAGLPRTLAILDPAVRPDGGSPHTDPGSAFRVNMRTDLHNIVGEVPFRKFLQQFGGAEENPPLRADLGRYLTSVKITATTRLEALGYHVWYPRATATSLLRNGSHYRVRLDRAPLLNCRRLILATGNAIPSIPSNLIAVDGCLDRVSCYDGGSSFASRIDRDDRVLVLGAGPSAVDVARHLVESSISPARIDLVSRTGMLSAVQAPEPPSPDIFSAVAETVDQFVAAEMGIAGLDSLGRRMLPLLLKVEPMFDLQRLRKPAANPLSELSDQIALAQRGGPPWRQVLEAIGSFAPRLWRTLADTARAEFLENWGRLYYVKRHAMPLGTGRWLVAQLATERVRIGALRSSVDASAGGVKASIDFFPGGVRRIRYDKVVVATGPDYSVARSRNPLLRQIVERGLAHPYTVQSADRRTVDLGGFLSQNLELSGLPGVYAMGAVARGEYFAVHSFPALAKQARIVLDGIQGHRPASS